ncbi:MAG: hypothetical protein ACR2NA_08625, partial [Solirubrobacterales bacterium]
MPLRSLLQIAHPDERFAAFAAEAAAARPGAPARAFVSASLRPYVCAALVDDDRALGGRPTLFVTADDRSAADLARELGAYLAPRPVRFYPSRGTGFASHIAPPPHLAGLRVAALEALTADRQAGAEAAVVVGGGQGLACARSPPHTHHPTLLIP